MHASVLSFEDDGFTGRAMPVPRKPKETSPAGMALSKPFGRRLRAWREHKGMTQIALAYEAKLSMATLISYEHGRRTPRLQEIGDLAGALGVPPEQLIFRDPPNPDAPR